MIEKSWNAESRGSHRSSVFSSPIPHKLASEHNHHWELQIVKANRLANVSGHQTCWTPTALYAQQNWQCCKRKTYVASADLFCIGQSVSLDNLYWEPRISIRLYDGDRDKRTEKKLSNGFTTSVPTERLLAPNGEDRQVQAKEAGVTLNKKLYQADPSFTSCLSTVVTTSAWASCISTPCYYIETPEDKVIFIGDTLFLTGSGRFFEGTTQQMYDQVYHTLITKLSALPDYIKAYRGHE
ncbi:hydroxyacylglutathione hydrolase [Culex quinquefasciatus]|uniref:Hydroxyacylglutathione hydrolase n=2 Tax=Culex pipiens complex TaxID=518105 RepID=B0X990_CULQU|nr:hydroxyacylglutathione hydrolase [Culex quinquefasciatus]|eukprot:XP_001866212.1 hydroxyacylglutathione hydrolase [Culex quinquefasciatus]